MLRELLSRPVNKLVLLVILVVISIVYFEPQQQKLSRLKLVGQQAATERITTQVKGRLQHRKYVPGPSAQPAVERKDLSPSVNISRYLKAKLPGQRLPGQRLPGQRGRPAVYVPRRIPRGRATSHPDCSAGGVNATRLHPDYHPLLASQRRVKAIQELCATPQYYKTRQWIGGTSLVSSDEKTLTYCPVPKSGWSTWKHLFFRQEGKDYLTRDKSHNGWNSWWSKIGLSPTKNTDLPYTANRMVFVRNPYDRLVSAYKDKVLGENGRYVSKGTLCAKSMFNRPPAPLLTFKQFISCIIRNAKIKTRNLMDFESGGWSDEHWKPQTMVCNFCTTDFNIIGHAEYMVEDAEMALRQLGMKNMSVTQCNKSSAKKVNYSSVEEWYKTLGDNLLKEFQELYYHDFVLLGYSMEFG